MKYNKLVFLLSTISLIITISQFWNLGIYVDEYGTSPSIVLGGESWLYLSWIKLFILFVLSIISASKLIIYRK